MGCTGFGVATGGVCVSDDPRGIRGVAATDAGSGSLSRLTSSGMPPASRMALRLSDEWARWVSAAAASHLESAFFGALAAMHELGSFEARDAVHSVYDQVAWTELEEALDRA